MFVPGLVKTQHYNMLNSQYGLDGYLILVLTVDVGEHSSPDPLACIAVSEIDFASLPLGDPAIRN